MYKLLILLFVFSKVLLASISYTKTDYELLKEFDINKSFLKDKTLNNIYKKISRNSHLHKYRKNIKEASIIIPKMRKVLEKHSLPKSFIYIPMAESSFKIDTKSNSIGATGLWQFMPKTAKLFGLREDKYLDERLDFIKSTKAASKYLKSHHKMFAKWYLSVLAYNCGEGRVIEAITRAKYDKYIKQNPKEKNSKKIKYYKKTIDTYLKTRKDFYKLNRVYKKMKNLKVKLELEDLLKINKKYDRQYLPKESRIYLRKILAFGMLGNRNFKQKKSLFHKKKDEISIVKLKAGTSLKKVAKNIVYPYEKFVKLNLHLKQKIAPKNKKYINIYLPSKKVARYKKTSFAVNSDSFLVHKVKSGDTLSSIGRKYKIGYGIIKDYNELKSNMISINQKLIIPLEKEKI